MTYTPTVTVSYGGPYEAEVELIQSTLQQNPSFTNWDSIFPNPAGISQGAVDWINSGENPLTFKQTAVDDTPGPSTEGATGATQQQPVAEQMWNETPRPY